MQANAQLNGLGDHSKLYSENDQAEQQQRKLSREQASTTPDDTMLRKRLCHLTISRKTVCRRSILAVDAGPLFQWVILHVQDMARGSLSTVRQGIQRAKSDLSAKEYRNIDSKYRNQLLELKTAEMAASDLNEYHKVCSSWPAFLPAGQHLPL